MVTPILIGLLGGLITVVSPCILPVLPVVFLAGGTGKGENAGQPARSPAQPEPATKTINVTGSPTLYRLTDDENARTARLELRVGEGLQAYVFTFG